MDSNSIEAFLDELQKRRESLQLEHSQIGKSPSGLRLSAIAQDQDFAIWLAKLANPLLDELRRIEATKWFQLRIKILSIISKVRRRPKPILEDQNLNPTVNRVDDFAAWKRAFIEPSALESKILIERLQFLGHGPKVAILVFYDEYEDSLREELVRSLTDQVGGGHEILWIGNAVPADLDQRMKKAGISAHFFQELDFSAISLSSDAAYFAALEPGYIPNGYFVPAFRILLHRHPTAQIVYGDEEMAEGHAFKPNWNRLLLASTNCIGHAVLISRFVAERVLTNNPPTSMWALLLACTQDVEDDLIFHIPTLIGKFHSQVRGWDAPPPELMLNTFAHVDSDEVRERKWSKELVSSRYNLSRQPKVSILIPTRDQVDLLRRCIESIQGKTNYPDFEILILDNGSHLPATLKYFDELRNSDAARIVSLPGEFNYAHLNNVGAAYAKGEVLALLNNDTEVLDDDWMSHLVYYAIQPEVAAVGARLLYEDLTVQFGGFLLGLRSDGFGRHAFVGLPSEEPGYGNLAVCDQWVSALTGACFFIRRDLYSDLGGLDSEAFPVTYNDVDLCMRAMAAGYRNVYAGSITLIHHESRSRGMDITPEKKERSLIEAARLIHRWGESYCDPFYNPNLTLAATPYELAWPPRRINPS